MEKSLQKMWTIGAAVWGLRVVGEVGGVFGVESDGALHF